MFGWVLPPTGFLTGVFGVVVRVSLDWWRVLQWLHKLSSQGPSSFACWSGDAMHHLRLSAGLEGRDEKSVARHKRKYMNIYELKEWNKCLKVFICFYIYL